MTQSDDYVTADKQSAAEGETVTLSLVSGSSWSNLTVTTSPETALATGANDTKTFSMPASDITVTVAKNPNKLWITDYSNAIIYKINGTTVVPTSATGTYTGFKPGDEPSTDGPYPQEATDPQEMEITGYIEINDGDVFTYDQNGDYDPCIIQGNYLLAYQPYSFTFEDADYFCYVF